MSQQSRKRKYSAMAGNSSKDLSDLKCNICDVTFLHKNEAQQHLNSKKHKIKEEAHSQKCGIYVRGFHTNTKESDLIKYFSQFGNVIWAHFGHDFILLDFTEISSVQKVLSRGHFFGGRKLFVKQKLPRTFNSMNQNHADEEQQVQTKILSSLQSMNNFDQEVEYLQHQLQPTWDSAFPKYQTICQDLCAVLSGRFPYVDVHPFGSTMTGLSFNNSDIDIFVANVKQPSDDEVEVLYEIKKLLVKSSYFTNGLVIPGAKIPIIKCLHSRFRIKCDLNIKNMLGVCNSRLIHYYLNLHPKVKLVMIVLKYWAKVHKITGQNHLLTNYSLVMLYIFFLQIKYGFPTVDSLQFDNDIKSYEPYCVEIWNGNFTPNYGFYSEKFTKTSMLEIVKEFLQYYGEFSYNSQVVSPFLGKGIHKSDFQTPKDIPRKLFRYRNYILDENNLPLKVESPMCIQDPFEHCRNISGVITDSTLERFVAFCKLGEAICVENKNTLHKLLTEEPTSLKAPEFFFKGDILEMTVHKAANLKYLKKSEDLDSEKSENDLWFESVVNFVTMAFRDFLGITVFDFYPENKNNKLKENKNIENDKKDTEIIEIHSESDDESQKSKNIKNEGQLDVHDKKDLIEIENLKNEDTEKCIKKIIDSDNESNSSKKSKNDVQDHKNIKVYHCEAKHNMWDARKKTAKQFLINKSASTLIERENLITEHLKSLYINFQDVASILTFTLTLENRDGSANITLEKTFTYKKQFRSFALFVGSHFPVWFEMYEKDLNKAVLDSKST